MFQTPLRKLSRKKRESGFTLIEVLVVASVIVILTAIAIPNFMNSIKRARIAQGKAKILSYKAAIQLYHTDTRRYPESGSEHVYYLLTGLAPFNQKTSKRYNPPYTDFTAAETSKGTNNAEYAYEDPIQVMDAPGSSPRPLTRAEIRESRGVRYPGENGVKFQPLLDPWGRPIVYISPVDLKKWFNNDTERPTPWADLISVSDETSFNVRGEPANIPYDMEVGQLYSAGPDAITALNRNTDFGLFQPGNLVGDDGKDNDMDGLGADLNDNKPKGPNISAEDDISSW